MVASGRRLTGFYERSMGEYEVSVIDTPPNSARLTSVAMGRADVIIIPTRVGGAVPERVGIAAGPRSEPYRQGIDVYDVILRRALSIAKEHIE